MHLNERFFFRFQLPLILMFSRTFSFLHEKIVKIVQSRLDSVCFNVKADLYDGH